VIFSTSQSDGIMGLAYSSLSDGVPTIIDQMVQSGQISNVFSLCLGESGGSLVLGGTDATLFQGSFAYTPIIKETYYVVDLQTVVIAGSSIDFSQQLGSVILDSGTSGITMPVSLFNQVINAFSNYCQTTVNTPNSLCGTNNVLNAPNGNCINTDQSDLSLYPTMQFVFRGVDQNTITVSIGPQSYLRFVNVQSTTCVSLGIYGQDGLGVILGDTFLKGFYTVFDRQNLRIGFATDVNCGSGIVQTVANSNAFSLSYSLPFFALLIILSILY